MGPLLSLFVLGTVLWFGIILLVTGLFTVYFGTGKSRTIGLLILALGVVFGTAVVLTQVPTSGPVIEIAGISAVNVGPHLIGILGAVVGGILGLLLFLFCLMKA